MDFIKRNVLRKHSDLIIKDLHGDVFEILRDKGILTEDEFSSINLQGQQEERNKKFLDILYTKPEGFNPFLDSLKDWYSWIEQRLRDTLTARPKTLTDAIAISKVPAIPLINVSRDDLLNQVRKALINLKTGEYVVLHGMSGCGKSSLAAEALHHDILLKYFEGRVVWLGCGHDIKDDENEVLALQREMNSAICDDELVKDVKAATINSLRQKLQQRFRQSDFKNGLVVLDDVNSPNVIEALRIGCKTLITTQDKDVMKNQGSRCTYIQVSESFKEEETMLFLAQCVKMSVDRLPPQAREIHRYGKGHPLIMALIGAHLGDHQEESQLQVDNWEEWLKVLVKKEYGVLNRHSSTNELSQQSKTIEICINNLSPELREKYQDFALFVEDVNIKTEVLEILWDLRKKDVKTIMMEFYKKSLVVRKYNEAHSSYVYGIHDVLRYFLRQRLDHEALKSLHLKLINRYKSVCDGDLSRLPRNDNYFFYYIGYHIASSKQYDMFPEWYFNLDFLEAKLKVAGPGDLLLDYKRYGPYFTDNLPEAPSSSVSKRLMDFMRFVETAGLDVRLHNCPDIVQLALQEPHDSDVYRTALQLLQSRPHKTYLRFQLGPSKSKAAPHTIQTREKVSAACFSNNDDYLIVGFESGTIQIVNQRGHKVREYEGHPAPVSGLCLSSQKLVFLSVSGRRVELWKLPDMDYTVDTGASGDRSPSPSQRQEGFAELFSCKSPERRKSWHSLEYQRPVSWAGFSVDGSTFAVCCTEENKVEIYELAKDPPCFHFIKIGIGEPTSCAFSADGRFIAIGCSSSRLIVHTVNKSPHPNRMVTKKIMSYPVLSLFALPDVKFGVLTKASLSVWGLIDETKNESPVPCLKETPVPCLKDYTRGDSELYIRCAAAADGSVVAVATSNSKILICDPGDGSIIREIHESTGNITYLAMDQTKNRRLLASYDDCTVRVWRLGEVHTHRPATMRSNFVVAWMPNNKPLLVAPTLKSCVKIIADLRESRDLPVPVSGEINICAISECGGYLVVGTPSGRVFLQQLRDGGAVGERRMEELMTLHVSETITKLSVKVVRKKLYVMVGLSRSIMVWTCKVESEENETNEDSTYKNIDEFQFILNDRLLDSFILPSEKLISVTKMGNIRRRCLKRGQSEFLVHGRLDNVLSATDLSCDFVLATLACATTGNTVNLYHVDAAELQTQSFKLPEATPTCCSFSLDGKKLAIGFANGLIQLWDMATLDERTVSTGGEPIDSVCVSRTGVIGAATKCRLVLVTSAGSVGHARLRVSRVVMSPDDSTVITVDKDGHLHLVDQFNNSNCGSVVRLSRSFSNM